MTYIFGFLNIEFNNWILYRSYIHACPCILIQTIWGLSWKAILLDTRPIDFLYGAYCAIISTRVQFFEDVLRINQVLHSVLTFQQWNWVSVGVLVIYLHLCLQEKGKHGETILRFIVDLIPKGHLDNEEPLKSWYGKYLNQYGEKNLLRIFTRWGEIC